MAQRSPILGYNHNLGYRGLVFHVQTEDSGIGNPHLFTHLFHGGVIVSSRRLDYDADAAEEVVKALMQAQHKAVLKGLRRGHFDDKIDAYLGSHPDLQPRGEPGTAAEPAEPAASLAAEPAASPPAEPVARPLITTEPSLTESSSTEPAASLPAASLRATTEPSLAESSSTELAASQRATTEPDPVVPDEHWETSEPAPAEPDDRESAQPSPVAFVAEQAAWTVPTGAANAFRLRNNRSNTEVNPVVPPPVRPPAPAPRQVARSGTAAVSAPPGQAPRPGTARPPGVPPPVPRPVATPRQGVPPPVPRPATAPHQVVGRGPPGGTAFRRHVTQPGMGKSTASHEVPSPVHQGRGNVLVSRPPIVVESKPGIPTPPRAPRPARIAPARTVREEPQNGMFDRNLISEKSLDEVILAYLSEDSSED